MNAETEGGTVAPPEAAAEPTRNVPVWRPLTDVVETAEGIMLMMEVPGVAAEDVEITMERRVLTVRGRGSSPQPDRLRPAYMEFEAGDYERSFVLSEDFDAGRIEAELKHGVLTLKLPRVAEAQPRKIQVKAA
ncbi:Hsp20/alpha crystallin family protein [Elioraea sp.]|jgi:HSP20 family molecular chaperone IbpA|uniref:Hsp20/alpha crystallin family protein n=1 Tax=Elioraea sp. TaxID=2185103 RepID=UPI0021DEA0A4|nr:Hsp20/alpha crystallin family protein [Elioraea sp.]GIX11624.1 MAG: heat-shock protein [Elioraea sp.]